ncbi:MAG TPA: L-seryl-tRNA(Sec) selenium transferase [Tepidisphaeraceae bacterium]|nr:L-seryl-tRNA(Sec) selenium transferase [Tepidisphaeraceae bacterium]
MTDASSAQLRALPSVDRAAREAGDSGLPRPLVLAVVRRELAAIRARMAHRDGHAADEQPIDERVRTQIRSALDDLRLSRIQPIINGTGIIVHTNFARSPLPVSVAAAINQTAIHYSNLEYHLAAGDRGWRGDYVEFGLGVLCAASAAAVVNNCAAALVLILRHFASKPPRTHVVISRGELVQIGGGFRVPEILQASGATLREVGTTNKTSLQDYRHAMDDGAAMILKVHRGNFFMNGFVESPEPAELAVVARDAGIPFIHDIGGGAMFDTTDLGGDEREPTAAEAIADGADLVCFSGDKLLGGPQAGIIVGSAHHIAALKKEPFFRALRCDKLVLCALQETVDLLLAGEAERLPIRRMMHIPESELHRRAARIVAGLADLPSRTTIGSSFAQVGGGTLPRTKIPSVTIDLLPRLISPSRLLADLRVGRPPIVGFIHDGAVKLDLRTIFPEQDEAVMAALRAALCGTVIG